ncbi:MAG: histidine kinase [Chromatiaceae bacterium]|nr:histidine kinase [Gammaproteobacteria bacterium]MCP5428220.1 histidine kinase [Chromatiaceae bacterium]MCB1861182.1 histidine kinase [Gammaproteobacteria bacterium]MCB1872288.1 histidine kinase [Gammaproteobacteria bacterium]MCB1878958.1 histidine kinase [Gammaproteobacteria bacterium]
MDQKIYATVIKAIAQQKRIDASSIAADSTLETLGISSLDAITIMYEIEDALNLEIPNESLEKLSSVQDILDGISQLVQSKA